GGSAARVASRQKAEAGQGAVDPAEGLPIELTDHDRAVGVHASGCAATRKHEDPHAARCRPAEGEGAYSPRGLTDHDRAVSVHAIGLAFVTSRQKADTDHDNSCRPTEGLGPKEAAGDGKMTEHDGAISSAACG